MDVLMNVLGQFGLPIVVALVLYGLFCLVVRYLVPKRRLPRSMAAPGED